MWKKILTVLRWDTMYIFKTGLYNAVNVRCSCLLVWQIWWYNIWLANALYTRVLLFCCNLPGFCDWKIWKHTNLHNLSGAPPNWQQIAKICSISMWGQRMILEWKQVKITNRLTRTLWKNWSGIAHCCQQLAVSCWIYILHFKLKKKERKRLGKCWTLRAACLCGGHALQKKQTETERLVQYADIIERSPAGRRFGVTPSALGSERLHFLDLGGSGGAGGGALHL